MSAFRERSSAPVKYVSCQHTGVCIIVDFDRRVTGSIDCDLPLHTKQLLRDDPHGFQLCYDRRLLVEDILLALLYVSLEYKKHNWNYTPDLFSRAFQYAINEYHTEHVIKNIIQDANITMVHFMVIVESWFLSMFGFLTNLFYSNELELLIRLRFQRVVPHGIAFIEK